MTSYIKAVISPEVTHKWYYLRLAKLGKSFLAAVTRCYAHPIGNALWSGPGKSPRRSNLPAQEQRPDSSRIKRFQARIYPREVTPMEIAMSFYIWSGALLGVVMGVLMCFTGGGAAQL